MPANPNIPVGMNELLKTCHLAPLREFANASESLILVRYAPSQVLLAANASFLRQLPGPDPAIGESIHRFLSDPIGNECSLLSALAAELPARFTVKVRATGCLYDCVLHADTDGYLLIGERISSTDKDAVERISLLANEMASLTIELRRRNAELELANATIRELTRVDPLTGIANRRGFAEVLDGAMSYARRQHQPLALICIDIDRFKTVNDTFGHDAGDEVLKQFALLLKSSCRNEDVTVRLGGEEFLLLAPGTAVDEAFGLAERLRLQTAQTAMLPKGMNITASFGVTQILPEDTHFSFMKRADMAMYEAKSSGRNKTVVRMSNDPRL